MAGRGKTTRTGTPRPDPGAPTEVREPETQVRGAPERGVSDRAASDQTASKPVHADPVEPIAALAAGTLVGGDYRILDTVGADETSISYKAEDVSLGVPVLLKEFAPARYVTRRDAGALTAPAPDHFKDYDAARAAFLREAQTLVRFRHASIARAHRVFEAHATKYIVLDYEEGVTFDTWLADLGQKPSQDALDRLTTPLLGALASVHAAGFVHGAIRPQSILVRDGGSPVLIDFAGACEMREGGGATECGPSSDIYGLAAVLYMAVSGKPAAAGAERVPAQQAAGDGYREEFLSAIEAGLAAQADARPQSVEDWDGIRAPRALESSADLAAPTLVRTAAHGAAPTAVRGSTGAAQPKTALADIATRVISAIPEIEEETDIPQFGFERWLLPAAITAGVLGALLFSTGMNFALAAVFQVAATGMFFLRGYMPLSRYLSHTTRQTEAIVRRAEQATRTAAWMIAALMVVMMVNPLFVERFIASNTAVSLTVLSAIIAVPALVIAACGYLGMPARWSLTSLAAGVGNMFVVIFNVLLFSGFVFTLTSTPENAVIHPAVQVNRYLYIIATVAAGTLGVLIFLSRAAARQRIKQAAVSR